MTSAIDPTKPEDGVPASKAELRANLETVKSELEHGGFAGAFGPARYGPPASDRVADHLAAIDSALGTLGSFSGLADTPSDYTAQGARFVKVKADESGLEFAPAPGGSGGLTGWTDVNVDFGATGDGATDDTAALQAALASGAAVVYLPPGTYRISASLSVIPGTTVLGAGPGQTVIDATGLPDQNDPAAIFCQGAPVSLPVLSTSLSEGDKSITFASSVAGLVEQWDMIGLVDTRSASFTGGVADRQGAFVCAHAVDGGKVYLDTALPRDLPSPRLAGGTVNDVAAVVLDRRGVRLQGFQLDCRGLGRLPDGTSNKGNGITCRYLANVWLEDVMVRGAPTYGAELDRCARGRVLGCTFTANDSGWVNAAGGYGFGVYGCAFINIWGCYFGAYRKGLDIGSGGGENPIRQLTAHDIIVDSCNCHGMADDAFVAPDSVVTTAGGCHPNCFNLTFANSIFRGTFTLRGFGHRVVNNTLVCKNDAPNAALITDSMGPKYGSVITGNHFIILNNNNAIQYGSDEHSDTEPAGILDISDNLFEMRGSISKPLIEIDGGVKANKAYIKIHNNVVVTGNAIDFVAISSSDQTYARVSIMMNQLTSNMSLGTVSNVASYRAFNMIGDDLHFANLPTTNPGGAGRLWSDAGTLKIT